MARGSVLAQPLPEQFFRYLNGVQGRPFAQIIGNDPEVQAIIHGIVLADAADKGVVLPLRVERERIFVIGEVIDDLDTWRLAQ